MQNRLLDQILALAGVFQAAALVDRLAKTGAAPEKNVQASVASLFVFDPATTEDVYGGDPDYRQRLDLGINTLKDVFDKRRGVPRRGDLIDYAVGLLYLEAKLRNHRPMLDLLGSKLRQIQARIGAGGPTDDSVIAAIADGYQQTLSTFRFRIHVQGERGYLQNSMIANKVRALLLAGVRAAMLWYQVGGRRWQIPLYRKRKVAALDQIS